jgi:lipoate-protein ligase B
MGRRPKRRNLNPREYAHKSPATRGNPSGHSPKQRLKAMKESVPLDVMDLGRRDYEPVLALQESLVAGRKQGTGRDTLVVVEHEPVFTLGRNAGESNVLASPDDLRRRRIRVVRTGRGGDVTYHGPGQLVVYPIVSLRERGKGVLWYVESLEAVLIETLAGFGIDGKRDRRNRGVWVGGDKVAAIGVRVTGRVTMHGFALNVRVDPADYNGIIPCGVRNGGVTSMHLHVPDVSIARVRDRLVTDFCRVFGYRPVASRAAEQGRNPSRHG